MSKATNAASPASPVAGGAPSSSEPTVSKYAGQPGALTAIRVDYSIKDKAFPSHSATSALGKVREEVRHLSSGPRLGDKPLWNHSSSTVATTSLGGALGGTGPIGSVHHAPPESCLTNSVPGLPQRALMSQNSAYQAVKLNYNYRADTLPPVKDMLYIPKPNKLEVDKTVFLTSEAGKGTTIITNKCLTTATNLSRCEGQNNFNGRKNGEIHPLSDTFGAHNVKRHMTVRGPKSSELDGRESAHSADEEDEDGTNRGPMNTVTRPLPPATLRDRADVDVLYAQNSKAQREAGWNVSAALEPDRTNIYKYREYKDYRGINKRKEGHLVLKGMAKGGATVADTSLASAEVGSWGDNPNVPDPEVAINIDVAAELQATRLALESSKGRRKGVYTTPIERQKQISSRVRQEKIEKRKAKQAAEQREVIDAQTLRGGSGTTRGMKGLGEGVVYKMSNKDEWWSALPPHLDQFRAQLAGSHVKATDTFNDTDPAGDPSVGATSGPTAEPQVYTSDSESD